MASELYARGNGTKTLNNRFRIFKKLLKFLPMVFLFAGYVILQAQVKTVYRNNDELVTQKNMLAEELERLTSDYDKMLSYSEIKEFAHNELSMTHSVKNLRTFAIIDKDDIFNTGELSKLPSLFETNFDLASLEPEESSIPTQE
ncbi:TPA: hypothetical protein DCR49_08945 [Candidatus Delongbacteria bacterium]|nr:MAG: hypothetical protein A2Y39_06780 [Candidatus Delongbacteria bacterium GWF2_40_14]HAQ62100.1 hypothetical protein [Candidatus Delongbacteria bacterium]